jgi:hypothetical protein
MKWGIRKRYDNRDEVISKGKTIYRATTTKNEKNSGYMYAVKRKSEADRYVKWIQSSLDKTSKVYTLNIPVHKTLIGPSEKKRIDVMIDMYRDKKIKDIASKKIKSIYTATPYTVIKKDINEASRGNVSRTAQEQFSLILVGAPEIRKEYFKRLSSMGYNMVADDNDRLSGMSSSSILVFNRAKTLGKVK